MKILFFLLFSSSLYAQNIWQEYIVGKPIAGYVEARKLTAEKWGIHYKATLAGCVINEEVSQKMEKVNTANEKYLAELTKKFGKDWLKTFNFECNIARLKNNKYLKGKWIDPVAGRPNKNYYDSKQKLANSWGIAYEPLFLNCSPSDISAAQQQQIEIGAKFQEQLNQLLGEEWKPNFDRELLKIEETKNPSIKDVWAEYLLDKVDESYYQTKKEVLKNWGISYQPYFVHCCKNKNQKMKAGQYAQKAQKVKTQIAAIFGANWEQYLKIEIEKKRADISK